jgi:hypothetical protein
MKMSQREFRLFAGSALSASGSAGAPRKVRDLTVYGDELYYSAFPSVVRRPDGELVCAFRHAFNRRLIGEPKRNFDPNSQLVLVPPLTTASPGPSSRN